MNMAYQGVIFDYSLRIAMTPYSLVCTVGSTQRMMLMTAPSLNVSPNVVAGEICHDSVLIFSV